MISASARPVAEHSPVSRTAVRSTLNHETQKRSLTTARCIPRCRSDALFLRLLRNPPVTVEDMRAKFATSDAPWRDEGSTVPRCRSQQRKAGLARAHRRRKGRGLASSLVASNSRAR